MESKAKKKGSGVVLFAVLSVLFAVLFAAACIGSQLAFASSQAVNIALQTSTFDTRNTDADAVYYESDFDSVEALEAHDKEIAEQLTGEGSVLLKNDGALPLAAGTKVSTLSHSSVDIVTCGTGSADIDTSKAPTLKEALEAVGLEVNPHPVGFLHHRRRQGLRPLPRQGRQPGRPCRLAHQRGARLRLHRRRGFQLCPVR